MQSKLNIKHTKQTMDKRLRAGKTKKAAKKWPLNSTTYFEGGVGGIGKTNKKPLTINGFSLAYNPTTLK